MSEEKIICRQKGNGEFRPDWCVYEASQESLREHMLMLKLAHESIGKLRAELRACVNHLEIAMWESETERTDFESCINAANRALHETKNK